MDIARKIIRVGNKKWRCKIFSWLKNIELEGRDTFAQAPHNTLMLLVNSAEFRGWGLRIPFFSSAERKGRMAMYLFLGRGCGLLAEAAILSGTGRD